MTDADDDSDSGPAHPKLGALIRRHGIRDRYRSEVEAEVERLLVAPGTDDPDLQDRTALPFVTIDNVDSMDLDQALYVERRGDDEVIVYYALADASYYVPPTSALFAEALERGVSYYLPGTCVPMLPRALSEGIVSLNPQVDRRALLFSIALDPAQAHTTKTTISRARIRSRAKLTYDGVQAFYDDPEQSPLSGQPYTESLSLLAEIGQKLISRADRRGVIPFHRSDVEVTLRRDDQRLEISREQRNDASRYNEQISLLCNMEGAQFLSAGGADPETQAVYRVHDPPDDRSLGHLQRVIDSVVALHQLDRARWRWKRGEQTLAAYLHGLQDISDEQVRIRQAIERQILIANRRSEFVAEPGRHFALGVDPYSRFSSPMREIVGIFTHKEALERLRLVAPASHADDEQLRQRVIQAANRSRERQRQLDKAIVALALDELFGAQLALPRAQRPLLRATIVGFKPTRVYVTVDDPPLELKVAAADFEGALGALQIDAREPALMRPPARSAPGLRLGERIALQVAGRDDRGLWHFSMQAACAEKHQ